MTYIRTECLIRHNYTPAIFMYTNIQRDGQTNIMYNVCIYVCTSIYRCIHKYIHTGKYKYIKYKAYKHTYMYTIYVHT